jgi:RNA polymerase sigma factor (sigma-70 family)
VLAARETRSPAVDEAMATLCETYWYPLFAFLCGRGNSAEDAADLVQSFFAQVLEKESLRHADPARGKFRSFLLTSIKNFASNEHDRQVAAKRGGRMPILSLEVETAKGRFQIEPPTDETPEKVFDRRWAIALIERVLARLREEMAPDKAQQFELLKMYLMGERGEHGYDQIAAKLGMSKVAVRVSAHRMRLRFRALLIEEIAHTVSTPEQIDDELRHLLAAVRAPDALPHPPLESPGEPAES